jgi:predicted anti-sigma-YlaC factor YlaD
VRIEDDITCAELVELVPEYLEGALEPGLVERFEEHLVLCDGCSVHVQQMGETIRLTGSLREEDVEPEAAERLLVAFRGWREAVNP